MVSYVSGAREAEDSAEARRGDPFVDRVEELAHAAEPRARGAQRRAGASGAVVVVSLLHHCGDEAGG